VAACGTVLALFAPGSAQAAPTWLSPVGISAGGTMANEAHVAFDAQGDAVSVWQRKLPDAEGGKTVVQTSTHPAGGVWSAPEIISAPDGDTLGAQLAVDPQGNAVAVWQRAAGNLSVVQASSRPAGGAWSAPLDLSDPAQFANEAKVALDPQGMAMVLWSIAPSISAKPIIQSRTRAAGGDWGPVQNVSSVGDDSYNSNLQFALDAHGNAVATWLRSAPPATVVQAATRPAGGAWSASPQPLSDPGAEARFADVGLDAQGNAVAVWQARGNTTNTEIVLARVRPAAGGGADDGWSAPQQISANDQSAQVPLLIVDPMGDATVVWVHKVTTPGIDVASNIQGTTRAAGGAWTAPQDLSPALENADYPQLAVGPQGHAVAVWRRLEGATYLKQDMYSLVARARPPAGAWGDPKTVSPPNPESPVNQGVAVDPQGNAVVVWPQFRQFTSNYTTPIQAAGYDAAGPQLRGLSMPDSGTVGSPLSFSVAPVDVWSSVASTRWNFGDGSGADGASVSHSYSAPSNFPVTVRSTDSLGNASTETRSVAVQGPAVLGGLPVSPASGTVSPTVSVSSEAQRLLAFRRCMSLARASTGAARLRAQQRCVLLYGRTPGRVLGLRARAVSANSVVLSFLAPGTDGLHPPAALSYVVKQSTRPITDLRSFRRARTLCAGRCRFANVRLGQRLSETVTDLRSHRTYYYAVRARDNVTGRPGLRSRSVAVRTR